MSSFDSWDYEVAVVGTDEVAAAAARALDFARRSNVIAMPTGADLSATLVFQSVERVDGGFALCLENGWQVRVRALLLLDAFDDQARAVGLARELGADRLAHCPDCYGWSLRDRAIGIVDPEPLHLRTLRAWSSDVVGFDEPELVAERFDAAVFGTRDVIFAPSGHSQIRPGLDGLGLATCESDSGFGPHVATDVLGRTNVPGVWAAGRAGTIATHIGAMTTGARYVAGDVQVQLALQPDRPLAWNSPRMPMRSR